MPNVSETFSFDDLSTVYRMERKSATLSAVRRDLYPAMATLLVTLRIEYEKQLANDPESLICEGANQRRKRANNLSKEIAEIRMGKICSIALLGARGGQNVLDTLTSEERDYYQEILELSKRHVNLVDRLSGKKKFETPAIDPEPIARGTMSIGPSKESKKISEPADMPPYIPDDEFDVEQTEEPDIIKDIPEKVSTENEMLVIRILEDLPTFSGPDRNYELSKEDIVRMPKVMAEALINREKAMLLSPLP
jgi:hypothetical protein